MESDTTAAFRPAEPGDRAQLLDFMAALAAHDGDPFDRAAGARALDQLLANPRAGCVWLIEVGGEPAGYAVLTVGFSLEYQGPDAFVDELYLAEPYRGQGIGRQALTLLERAAKERGVRAIHLEVKRSNLSAQAVYRRAGFVDHDRYLMTKWLGDPDGG